jgi:hypothetical protein
MEIVLVIFGVIFLAWLGITIFMILWNTTVPQVFGLKIVTFWQSFRLLLLSSMLFGGLSYTAKFSGDRGQTVQIQSDTADQLRRISDQLDRISQQLLEDHR